MHMSVQPYNVPQGWTLQIFKLVARMVLDVLTPKEYTTIPSMFSMPEAASLTPAEVESRAINSTLLVILLVEWAAPIDRELVTACWIPVVLHSTSVYTLIFPPQKNNRKNNMHKEICHKIWTCIPGLTFTFQSPGSRLSFTVPAPPHAYVCMSAQIHGLWMSSVGRIFWISGVSQFSNMEALILGCSADPNRCVHCLTRNLLITPRSQAWLALPYWKVTSLLVWRWDQVVHTKQVESFSLVVEVHAVYFFVYCRKCGREGS